MLTRYILAESTKIGHKLAESTKSVNGFDWPEDARREHVPSSGKARLKADLSGKFHFGSNPKTAINALSANLFRE